MTQAEQHEREMAQIFQPTMRTFSVQYADLTTECFSSHYLEVEDGALIFYDQQRHGDDGVVLFARRTIASGQWRQVTEITAAVAGKTAH